MIKFLRHSETMARWLAFVWCLYLLPASPASGQAYTIRTLGPPPTNPAFTYASTANAVNNKDEVLAGGVFGAYSDTPSMFLLQPDYGMSAGLNYLPFFGVTNMAVLAFSNEVPITDTVNATGPQSFNDQGQILGTLISPTTACVWQDGKVTSFGSLGGGVSHPFAINQNGDVIGYSNMSPGDTNFVPFMVLAGTTTMQAITGMDENTVLVGFNSQRQVLFTSRNNYQFGFSLWQNGLVQSLADIVGVTINPPVYITNPDGTRMPADGTYRDLTARSLNDNGEIHGYVSTQSVKKGLYGPSLTLSFYYSPLGGNGFPSGVNYNILQEGYYATNVMISMNNSGEVIYLSDHDSITNPYSYDYYLWDKGQTQKLQNLLPANSGWTDLLPAALNDRGDIIGQGFSNGVSQAFLLSLPAMSVTVTATPSRVSLGDKINVTVTAINNNRVSPGTLTGVQFGLPLSISGTGGVKPQSAIITPPPTTISPTGTATYSQTFIATAYGPVTFSASITGNDPQGHPISASAQSPPVTVQLAADLLVKTADPNDTTFMGGGEYQQAPPNGDQNVSLPVSSSGTAGYVVRLQNNSPTGRTFLLHGTTNSLPNWTIQALAGGASIIGALTSSDGWTSPELAPGAYVDMQVSLAPTASAGQNDNKTVLITVQGDSTSTDILDAVLLHAVLVPVPVQVNLMALTASGITSGSIQAGMTAIDAPLVPALDPALLASQPIIHGGLVADDVTPLIIQLSVDPDLIAPFTDGLRFDLQATTSGPGALNGSTISERLEVLENGAWEPATNVTLSPSSPMAYVEVPPIMSQELLFSGLTTELNVDLSVMDDRNGAQAGDVKFGICKPPIALIHGVNSTGDWGSDFKGILGTSRPLGAEGDPNNFICTVKYGQDTLPGNPAYPGVPVYVNTVASLDELAPMVLQALDQAMTPLHSAWAFTRYDVVAHSQGGVLARMLCNANGNSIIPQPFRNADNFNRGRFHQIVTIGSPQNGTRILRYLLDLYQLGKISASSAPPQLVAALGINSGIASAKFDPFGPQIAEINNPSPSARWQPDPGAQFHVVRTSIDGDVSPGSSDVTPLYVAMGLNTPLGGLSVIPNGSDGVVDFDSMGCYVPPAALGANVYTFAPANYISHSEPTALFGSFTTQTESTLVANHVIGAFDQNPKLVPATITFGPFSMPPLLSGAAEVASDGYAAAVSYQAASGAIQPTPAPLDDETNYQYKLAFPVNLPPEGDVGWFVQVYGPSGITSDGVELTTSGTNNSQVTVMVDSTVVGDVVLSATYLSRSNTIVAIEPTVVVSVAPPGVTLTGVQVLPGSIALPVGSIVSPQVVATYSDGSTSLRYVASNTVTVSSSQSSVVSVADPLNWQLSSVGTAKITLDWSGFQAVSQITVFDPASTTPPPLSLANSGNGQLTLDWPGFSTSFQLQSTGDLSATNSWQPVSGTSASVGGETIVALSATNAQQFYRLQFRPPG